MFPIRDHNPSGRTPYVVYALLALNVAIFLSYQPIMDNARALNAFFDEWALVPGEVTRGIDLHSVLTSMFLHGGWMHLAGNMLFLWIFGDNLEDEMGHVGFLVFYLASGTGAAIAQIIADPASQIPMVGASGAIAGVMGGYLLLFPKARVDILLILIIIFRIFTVPAWLMLGLWFGLQLFSGIASDASGGGVAYWAHAGGFVVGAILCLPVWLKRGASKFWDRTQGHPPHPEAKYRLSRSSVPSVRRRK
ncbi:membrane associated rhomboid family serine protease [Shimia isoporae]|uniref:Membrane associated rhomboid family serine protease n=1 Tax=Shimia isoporae TaxID=647720 RepID=A0A4R1NXP0_9RHOB|nr:rhomboid family intramembrane serine protease [Shimia isoporae]TCL09952.1 membrane associated rhomboid family serine protease [Shimia isoporae]